jgi:hypothetical protein
MFPGETISQRRSESPEIHFLLVGQGQLLLESTLLSWYGSSDKV